MKKYTYIDLAKTISMFLVVFCHILLFFSYNPFWFVYADYKEEAATYLCNIINCTVVPLFVFCSGFLFQVTLQRKEIKTIETIVQKAKRLLVPYFIYGLFWLVPTYTIFNIPTSGRPEGTSLMNGYRGMLLGQFCDVSWFLLMLFWVSAIWIIFRKLLKKELFILGIIFTALLYTICHVLLGNVNYYKLSQIDIYIVIFFIGASFYWIVDKLERLSSLLLMNISIFGMAGCTILAQYTAEEYWLYCILAMVMPLALSIFTMALCKIKLYERLENARIYKWLIKHNMDIYLLQAPAMYLSFMQVNSLVGQNFFLCVLLSYLTTIVLDFLLVVMFTYLKKGISYLHQKGKTLHVSAMLLMVVMLGIGAFFAGRTVENSVYKEEQKKNILLNRSELHGLAQVEGLQNADEELKKYATAIISSNDKDGVAHWLERYNYLKF